LVRPKPQALGKPPVCDVVAPVGAVPAVTHALLSISSKRSRADRPTPILIEGARPLLPCEGSRGPCTRHPGRDAPGDACRWSPGRRRGSRSLGPILVHHCEPEKYSLAIARHLKCFGCSRARRCGEGPMQTARALGPRTVCSSLRVPREHVGSW
jgi:hypothetical protein